VGTLGTVRAALKGGQAPDPRGHRPAMTRVRRSVKVGAIIALAGLMSSCGSAAKPQPAAPSPSAKASASPSSGVASGVPAAAPPAGYKWAGSAAQGVWFTVPNTWASLDLAKVSLTQALSQFNPKIVTSGMRAEVAQLSRQHAIFVVDLPQAVRFPNQPATNGNAFCQSSALVAGGTSSSALVAAMQGEYARLGAHLLAINAVTIDRDPGVKSKLTLTLVSGITVTEIQYVILTNDGRVCYVTLTTGHPAALQGTFNEIGATIYVS
jgi:hypothetical protein